MSKAGPVSSAANDSNLCAAIGASLCRLVFIALGVSESVAEAIDVLLSCVEVPAVTMDAAPKPSQR